MDMDCTRNYKEVPSTSGGVQEGPLGEAGQQARSPLDVLEPCLKKRVQTICHEILFFTCVPIPHLSCLHSCYAVISCCLRLFRLETAHKRGCYWTIEQPRSSLMAAYGPFKDRFCCLHAASMMVPLSRVLFLSHLIGRRPLRGMGHTLYTSPWVPWGRPR